MVGVCLGGRGDERVLRSRDPTAALLLPAEFKKFLLYARQMEIRGVDIDNPYYNYIISFTVPDIDNVTVVDYDALEQRIYWSDVRTQTIKRAFINGTGVETVVSAGGCGAPRTVDPPPALQSLQLPEIGPSSSSEHHPSPVLTAPVSVALQTCPTLTASPWTGFPETSSGPATTPTRSRSTWPGWTAPSRTP